VLARRVEGSLPELRRRAATPAAPLGREAAAQSGIYETRCKAEWLRSLANSWAKFYQVDTLRDRAEQEKEF